MPYIRIEANRPSKLPIAELQRAITDVVHSTKGDAREMISTVVQDSACVSFGGDGEKPTAILTMISTPVSPEMTHRLVPQFTELLGDAFEAVPERMYIFFNEYRDGHLVGWNGTTFDIILAAKPTAVAAEEQ